MSGLTPDQAEAMGMKWDQIQTLRPPPEEAETVRMRDCIPAHGGAVEAAFDAATDLIHRMVELGFSAQDVLYVFGSIEIERDEGDPHDFKVKAKLPPRLRTPVEMKVIVP